MVELGGPGPSRQVGGHGERGPAAEDVLDVAAEVAPGADVDEDPQPVAVHRLDRLAKRHRPASTGATARRRISSVESGMRAAVEHE